MQMCWRGRRLLSATFPQAVAKRLPELSPESCLRLQAHAISAQSAGLAGRRKGSGGGASTSPRVFEKSENRLTQASCEEEEAEEVIQEGEQVDRSVGFCHNSYSFCQVQAEDETAEEWERPEDLGAPRVLRAEHML